jgi:hypothetical protein
MDFGGSQENQILVRMRLDFKDGGNFREDNTF